MTPPTDKLDPELAEALRALPMPDDGLFDFDDIEGTRRAFRERTEKKNAEEPDDPSVAIEMFEAPRPDGSSIRIRYFHPVTRSGPYPAILWMHGGGQVFGYLEEEDPYLKRVCSTVGCAIISVDYRLAPEAPAPAAVEDCFAAWQWLCSQTDLLSVDPARIGIGGSSAGGGLAAMTTLAIRERGAPMPIFQSLTYPMLDDRNETRSTNNLPNYGIWDREENVRAWRAALGERAGTAEVSLIEAPARAIDLSNLPTAFLAAGEQDVFRDETIAYAAKLLASEVAAELHIYQGAYHGFDRFAAKSSMAGGFLQTWFGFLSRQFAR